jgi:tetratricopeptide (TPR) repeat protein
MRSPAFLVVALAACSPPAPIATPDPAQTTATPSPGATPSAVAPAGDARAAATDTHPPLTWIEDDVPAALSQAKREGKLVFVDTWAEWCHTCISMKHYVLDSPALRGLGSDVVFVAVDTEKEKNAAFVDQHAIDVWPTFFVIDPEKGDVLGYWPGSGSIKEMDAFVREALSARDERKAAKLDAKSPLAALLAAKGAQSRSAYDDAAKHYKTALERAPGGWPRRSEAAAGLVSAYFNAGRADLCVDAGLRYLPEVKGAAKPTDFCRVLLDCAEHAKSGDKRAKAQDAVKTRLVAIARSPHPESTPDDRADTLDVLADVWLAFKDKTAARKALVERLAILEKASKEAPSPAAAQAYDAALANALLAAGRPADAIRLLETLEKQLPSSYEPPGRLAGVLLALKKYREALSAVERALSHSEGPRRLRFLEIKADILAGLGDHPGQVKALEEAVAGYEAQARRQAAKPQRMVTAKRRLDAARAELARARGKKP